MFFQQSFRSLYLVYTVLWMGTSSEIVWVIQGSRLSRLPIQSSPCSRQSELDWVWAQGMAGAAIAAYACIAYMISVISLALQGVGDGSQPLISKYYGTGSFRQLRSIRSLAYGFSLLLSAAGCAIMYMWRDKIGVLFGASLEVTMEAARIIPIFLVSAPFAAIARITISSFYASKKTGLAYFLIFIEPVLMLIFMLFLPPLFGGQIMIWWSTVFARIVSAFLSWIMKIYVDKRGFSYA